MMNKLHYIINKKRIKKKKKEEGSYIIYDSELELPPLG